MALSIKFKKRIKKRNKQKIIDIFIQSEGTFEDETKVLKYF